MAIGALRFQRFLLQKIILLIIFNGKLKTKMTKFSQTMGHFNTRNNYINKNKIVCKPVRCKTILKGILVALMHLSKALLA